MSLLPRKFTVLICMMVHQKTQDHYSLYLPFFAPYNLDFIERETPPASEELVQLGGEATVP